jgi:multidrug efflux pump subunit AcrB
MGLFWNNPDKEETKKEEKKTVKTETASFLTTSTPTTATPTTAGKKEEFVKHFKKVMTDNNIPGPDYYEFELALQSMKSLPLDEKTKFITIFAGFQAQGVTKDKLLETANVYANAIADLKEQFEKDVQIAFDSKVKTKENEIKDIEAQNLDIDKQMIELTNKKVINQETIKAIKEEITNRTNQINGQKADFDVAYNEQYSDINKNIELIKTHLS